MSDDPMQDLRIQAAWGFWELGLAESALEELDELPEELRVLPQVLDLRLMILMEENRWEDSLAVADHLCRVTPAELDGWIKAAFCLHEMKRTAEARDRLLSGPPALREVAIFYYNLSCYECQLGHVQEAWLLLERAVALDSSFKKMATEDPDLAPLQAGPGKSPSGAP